MDEYIFPKYPGEKPKRYFKKPTVKNLLGKKFHKLTVIEYVGQRKYSTRWTSYWIAQCDCGSKSFELRTCDLTNNHTRSCGCLHKEIMEKKRGGFYIKDIAGRKFGRLTAIHYIESDKRWRALWQCNCDCGNNHIARASNLLSGNVKSCGCIKGNVDFIDYDKHKDKLKVTDKIRRDPANSVLLQVKCYKCREWFRPVRMQLQSRLYGLRKTGGSNFYCSDVCKNQCDTFAQMLYPKHFKSHGSRENFPKEIREMVLDKDENTCQKCGKTENLECHHIKNYNHEPIFSGDIDNIITVCKNCHKQFHKLPGCQYNELQCK